MRKLEAHVRSSPSYRDKRRTLLKSGGSAMLLAAFTAIHLSLCGVLFGRVVEER